MSVHCSGDSKKDEVSFTKFGQQLTTIMMSSSTRINFDNKTTGKVNVQQVKNATKDERLCNRYILRNGQ